MRDFLASLVFLLSVFVGYIQCQSTGDALPKSAEIYHWGLNLPQPSLLAKIAYNPDTRESKVVSYTPPLTNAKATGDESGDLYRIGFFTSVADGSKQWVGSLVSQSALDTTTTVQRQADVVNNNVLQLYLSASQQHDLYHVSLAKGSEEKPSESIGVELIYPDAGPLPELNKPVVISPDGTNPQEVVEKTFFQKYWWVLLMVTFLMMSGGGGGGEGQ